MSVRASTLAPPMFAIGGAVDFIFGNTRRRA